MDQAELDKRVRAVLGTLMSSQERPISNAEFAAIERSPDAQ
jgi:hypothetical protein